MYIFSFGDSSVLVKRMSGDEVLDKLTVDFVEAFHGALDEGADAELVDGSRSSL